MVLPASAADDALDSARAGWLSQLRLSLRLSRAGLLLLVDRARPERLSELVRGLYADHPRLEVLTEVRRAAEAREGSVLVLVPSPEDAGWLNLRRPLFSRLELKVVLWCDESTSAALARHAPDFFDWITQRQECPPGPVPHAVHGIRAAVTTRAPGIVWRAAATEETKARIAETVAAAVPDWDPGEWIVPTRDYAALLDKLDRAKDRCAVITADSPAKVRRTRWALAESKRSFPAIVVTKLPMGGYFPVHADCVPLAEARVRLEKAGAERPGCLAALSGLEPEAVDLIASFLEKGVTEREIGAVLSQAEDPGAALAKLGWQKVLVAAQDVIEGSATAPVYRALEGSPEVVHGREKWLAGLSGRVTSGESLSDTEIETWAAQGTVIPDLGQPALKRFLGQDDVSVGTAAAFSSWPELFLRSRPTSAHGWIGAAIFAAVLGDGRAAALWTARGLARASLEGAAEEGVAKSAAALARQLETQGLVHDARIIDDWQTPVLAQHKLGNTLGIGMIVSLLLFLGALALKLHGAFPWSFSAMVLITIAWLWSQRRLDRQSRSARGSRFAWLGLRPPDVEKAPRRKLPDGEDDTGFAILGASILRIEEKIERPLRVAEEALREGRHAEAESALRLVLSSIESHLGAEHPLFSRAQCLLAHVLFDAARYPESLAAIGQVFASDTDFANDPALFLLACRTLARLGRFTDAERALRHLLLSQPTSPTEPFLSAPRVPPPGPEAPDDPVLLHLLGASPGILRDHPGATAALGETLTAQGRYEEAQALADAASGASRSPEKKTSP